MASEAANVRKSVLEYLEAQLTGQNIDWPDVDFDTENHTNWVQIRLLGFTAAPTRKGTRDEAWTLDANCFAEVGRSGTHGIHKHWEIADAVITAVNQETIDLKDYDQSGDPVIDHLRFQESDITPVPRQGARDTDLQNVAQLNVSTEFHLMT